MLLLRKDATDDKIVVTLNEKTTIDNPNFLFVFDHIATKQQVKKVFLGSEDLSTHQTRYNEFEVNTSDLFTLSGQYYYKAYEQESTTNTDTDGLSLVEQGKLEILKEFESAIGYSAQPTVKGYEG